ncbi:MAG: glycosyltransferase family 4 protein [Myxococcota bacterium]
MRVLCLTIGPEAEPSSRFRVYQYRAPLARLGIELDVRPRVDQRFFEVGYGLRAPSAATRLGLLGASLARRSVRRARDWWSAAGFDLVWLQKETLPTALLPTLARTGTPWVFDFDDAIYAPPPGDDGFGRGIRAIADRWRQRDTALAALLPRCARVFAGSAELEGWARRHTDRVSRVPTVVDAAAYPVRPVRDDQTLTLGWVGAPAGRAYLEPLRPVLRSLARRHDLRLVLRGVTDFSCPGVRVETRPWRSYANTDDEARDLAGIDIGLMPLPETPYTAGKCAFKAIQYMASGIPVVASPVGANADVVLEGVTGYLPADIAAWEPALERLIQSAPLRAQLGRAGRSHVLRHYALETQAPRVAQLLRGATGKRATSRYPRRALPVRREETHAR